MLQFPLLRGYICGEEVNTFTNPLGESITVEVCATQDDTSTLLTKVLDGNAAAARLLAKAVHTEVATPELTEDVKRFLSETDYLDLENVGVWIDPLGRCGQRVRISSLHAFARVCVCVYMTTGCCLY